MRPSVASALGRLMSIGSSATKTRPSCAQATTDGCLTWGAWATSSMRQFGIGCGRTEAPKAEKLQKITKETKSERRNNSPFAIFGLTGLEGGLVIPLFSSFPFVKPIASGSQQFFHAQVAMPDGLLVRIVLQPNEAARAPFGCVGPGIDQFSVHPNRVIVLAANDFILVPLAGRFG